MEPPHISVVAWPSNVGLVLARVSPICETALFKLAGGSLDLRRKMRRTIGALLFIGMAGMLFTMVSANTDEQFGVKEYDAFHQVLHPLQHEALPAKDFHRVRSNSAELVKRGREVVRLGVPKGTA